MTQNDPRDYRHSDSAEHPLEPGNGDQPQMPDAPEDESEHSSLEQPPMADEPSSAEGGPTA